MPLNYILLFAFTLTESIIVGCIASAYDPSTVFIAIMLTASMVIGLTVYALYTKTDFTILGGMMFALVMILMAASILAIFIRNRWL